MKIGIVGAGLMGKTLAKKLSNQGHQIRIANSKGPETLSEFKNIKGIEAVTSKEAVSDAELIILTVPLGKVGQVKNLFENLKEEVIVLETMNYLPVRDGQIEDLDRGTVTSIWVENIIGRQVIKAFSNIGAYSLLTEGRESGSEHRIGLPVSGDDEKAKDIVIKLVDQVGFDGYDAGPISDSWKQGPVTPAYCTDLTLKDSKLARDQAVMADTATARDAFMQRLFGFGEEYFRISMTGDYPEGFVDKSVDVIREYFGLPARTFQE